MPADRMIHPRLGHSAKVAGLTDFEYRVWNQYLLSADDFGVMRATAVKLQADNDALAERPARTIAKALERLIAVGLLAAFEHQGRAYVCQLDWQAWQKVTYPRATNEPKPPADLIATMDAETQKLLTKHPGGNIERFQKRLENVSETSDKDFNQRAERLTANASGLRQTAHGERLKAEAVLERAERAVIPDAALDQPNFEQMLRDLIAAYPASGRSDGRLTQDAFLEVFLQRDRGRPVSVVYAELLEAIENHKASEQWAVKRMVPKLEKWLREGLYLQRHEPTKPSPGAAKARGSWTEWECHHDPECESRSKCADADILGKPRKAGAA